MGAPDDFRSMFDLVTASKLEPVVDRVFPLDEAVKAFRRMEETKQFGKIVLPIA
jgi:zinc-binding alcohol dehydrogenase/oxidoreductase